MLRERKVFWLEEAVDVGEEDEVLRLGNADAEAVRESHRTQLIACAGASGAARVAGVAGVGRPAGAAVVAPVGGGNHVTEDMAEFVHLELLASQHPRARQHLVDRDVAGAVRVHHVDELVGRDAARHHDTERLKQRGDVTPPDDAGRRRARRVLGVPGLDGRHVRLRQVGHQRDARQLVKLVARQRAVAVGVPPHVVEELGQLHRRDVAPDRLYVRLELVDADHAAAVDVDQVEDLAKPRALELGQLDAVLPLALEQLARAGGERDDRAALGGQRPHSAWPLQLSLPDDGTQQLQRQRRLRALETREAVRRELEEDCVGERDGARRRAAPDELAVGGVVGAGGGVAQHAALLIEEGAREERARQALAVESLDDLHLAE